MEKKSLEVGDDFTDCYGGEYKVSSIYVEEGVTIVSYSSEADCDYKRPLVELFPMIVRIGHEEYTKTRRAFILLPTSMKRTKWETNALEKYYEVTDILTLPAELQSIWDTSVEGEKYPWDHLEPIKQWLSNHSVVRDLFWIENYDMGVVVDLIKWASARDRQGVYSLGNSKFRYYP